MNLVAIPFHDWRKCEREGFRTRDAHFMQEFSRHQQVETLLVVNRPISISEIVIFRRNWRVSHGTLVYKHGFEYLTKVADNTYTLDIIIPEVLGPILKRRAWIPEIFGSKRVRLAIERALAHLDILSEPVFFISAPLFSPLMPNFPENVWVFDAQDNLLKHANYHDLPGLEEYYRLAQAYSSLITTNSAENAAWLSKGHARVYTIPNGVDADVFNPNVHRVVPPDLKLLRAPIVGYAGKMQALFDVPLASFLAERLPDVNFVFIGQILDHDWMKPLWQFPNVHYLGDKQYDLLPSYLAGFDICVIPYATERQHGGDPIKFYEYLAMNKPVVTTDIGNVSALGDDPRVRVVSTREDFLESIEYFLGLLGTGDLCDQNSLTDEHFWRSKANRLVTLMSEAVEMQSSASSSHHGKDGVQAEPRRRD